MSENSLNLIKCNIYCCYGTGCISLDCKNVFDALNDAVKSKGLSNKVEIIPTGCMGLCSKGPLLRIETNFTEPVLYGEVKPILARLIIAEHISELIKTKGKDLLLEDPTGKFQC